jgi:hypothetical protein
MTTLTSIKRDHFPHRFARKDARTAIYRALFGTGGHKHNDSATDDSRYLPESWSRESTITTLRTMWSLAAITDRRRLHDITTRCDRLGISTQDFAR